MTSPSHPHYHPSVTERATCETTIEAEDLGVLWKALELSALVPSTPQSLSFHAPGYPGGRAVDLVRAPVHGVALELSVERLGVSEKGFVPARVLRVRLEGARDEAAPAMERLVGAIDAARRMECRSAEHFLGYPKEFAWHEANYPRILLPALLDCLEQHLAGWTLVKIGRPRNAREVSRALVRDHHGAPRTVHVAARYFYHHPQGWWLVAEVAARESMVTVSLASSGTAADWEAQALAALDAYVRNGLALTPRSMSPSGEPLTLERAYGWDDLFIAADIKALLQRETSQFFDSADAYRRMGVPHRRGLLLAGPPGTGKTLLGKILSSTLTDVVFIWVTASDVGTAEHVRAIFATARSARRTVLFFEDLDFYASNRRFNTTSVLGELLVELDGFRSNDGLLVVATTNDLEAIEPALKDRPSRFDRVIELGPATTEVRRAHLTHLLAPYGLSSDALEALARRTDGLTGAQIQELAFRARLAAAGARRDRITTTDLDQALDLARKLRHTVGFKAASDDEDDDA